MQNKVARLISVLFHPVFMPTFGVVILFLIPTPFPPIPLPFQRMLCLIVFLVTSLIPMFILLLTVQLRIVPKIDLNNKNDRLIPMVFVLTAYVVCFFIIRQLSVNISFAIKLFTDIIQLFMFASLVTLFINMVVSVFWKISSHAMGIGGLIAAAFFISHKLMVDVQSILILLFIIAGFIGYSRLWLNVHNPAQVYAGLGVGIVSVYLSSLIS